MDKLKQPETLLRCVLDKSRDAHLLYDLGTGLFTYASANCQAVTGYTTDEFLAMKTEERLALVHPEDWPILEAAIQGLKRSEDAELEYRMTGKDGTYRWLASHVSTLRDQSGRPSHLISSLRDITQRKHVEAQREELTAALAEADRRMNELLAKLGHELHIPLAPVRSKPLLMEDAVLRGEQARPRSRRGHRRRPASKR